VEEMRHKYLAGNYGYGHAKKELLTLILENFKEERAKFQYLMANKNEIDVALEIGAKKARDIAEKVLQRVRNNVGY
jgi:tryptophanyl-tRNA synthetase